MYIFIDESGNFTGNKDNYFIIGGFVTGDQRRATKAFRKWQHLKIIGKTNINKKYLEIKAFFVERRLKGFTSSIKTSTSAEGTLGVSQKLLLPTLRLV